MAAPILKRYNAAPSAASTWTAVTPLVPAGRALVVSKIIVASNAAPGTLFLQISATAGGASLSERIVHGLVLGQGEVYSETGVIIPAGFLLAVFWIGAGFADVEVNVFGQEVDN